MMTNKEIWEATTGRAEEYPYEVSNKGRVRRAERKNIKDTNRDDSGYLFVQLWKNNKRTTFRVHALVADAFLGPPPGPIGTKLNEWQIDHIDDDKTNNCVENLEWVTSQENSLRALRGNNHAGSYYPDILVELIWVLYYNETFSSQIPRPTILDIICGKTRRPVTEKLGKPNPRKIQGENHGCVKLTKDDVKRIRSLYATGDYSYNNLAEIFPASRSQIRRIIKHESWKHV